MKYVEHRKTHCNCIICGVNNPLSLGLKFAAQPDGGVTARFNGSSLFQGYRGIIHGGIIAALLDATMTHCLFYNGVQAMTGHLNIRFFKPVPCSVPADLSAKVEESLPPLYKVSSKLLCGDELMAEASAKFMKTDES